MRPCSSSSKAQLGADKRQKASGIAVLRRLLTTALRKSSSVRESCFMEASPADSVGTGNATNSFPVSGNEWYNLPLAFQAQVSDA
jgi:hypothetical protein